MASPRAAKWRSRVAAVVPAVTRAWTPTSPGRQPSVCARSWGTRRVVHRVADMAVHGLSRHFDSFFGRINPSPTFVSRASSEYGTVKALIENPYGPAAVLRPQCFLQGSY